MIQTLRDLWRYRELVAILVGKELKLRYRRSVLGFAWTMLNPLLLVMFWQGVVPPLSILCVPLCLVILWLFTTGIVLALAAWTVFFRDLGQIVEVSLQALFYLTPIIYPLSILPERFLWIVKLNPLLHQVTVFRRVFFEGAWPEPSYFLIAGGCAIVSFAVGLAIFRRQESQFLLYLS